MKKHILVSAGDAVTARLVEKAGFTGVWISGFEASARLGLEDNGSITLTEMLNVAKPIVDSVSIPVWVDVDTGYSNFQRTVTEFERIGVAGVCVEDIQEGLKTNSLWGGSLPLMKTEDFCRKISVKRREIQVMARTEALIRGHGVDEAMKRLKEFTNWGADYVLPHVRREEDIIASDWYKMAIVPTKFPHYTNQRLFDMGYSMVIWANQTERVKIHAIKDCLGSLMASDCAQYVEENMAASLDQMKELTIR